MIQVTNWYVCSNDTSINNVLDLASHEAQRAVEPTFNERIKIKN